MSGTRGGKWIQKEVNFLLSKLFLRLDAITGINTINVRQEKSVEANVIKHNKKPIVAEEAVLDGVSDADVFAPHELFSARKFDAKGSVEVNKKERNDKRQRNSSGGAEQHIS